MIPPDRAKVREYAKQEDLPFPVLLADEDVIAAYNLVNRFLFEKIRDLAVPTSLLLDRDGNIVKIYRGQGSGPARSFGTFKAPLGLKRSWSGPPFPFPGNPSAWNSSGTTP